MMELQRGQKISVQTVCRSWTLEVELRHEGPLTVDVSCFGLDGAGRLSDERYFLFYNQRRTPDGAMVLAEGPLPGPPGSKSTWRPCRIRSSGSPSLPPSTAPGPCGS